MSRGGRARTSAGRPLPPAPQGGTGRAAGAPGSPACGGRASRGAPTRDPAPRPAAPASLGRSRSQKSGVALGLFSGQLPLPPASSPLGVLLSSNDRGRLASPRPAGFVPVSCRLSWQVPGVRPCVCVRSPAGHPAWGLCVLSGTRKRRPGWVGVDARLSSPPLFFNRWVCHL